MKSTKVSVASAGLLLLAMSGASVHAYNAIANVQVSFGGHGPGAPDASLNAIMPNLPSGDIVWTSNGTNALASIASSTYFTTQSGYNSLNYYNADFVSSAAECAPGAGIVPANGGSTAFIDAPTRKYGCRWSAPYYGPLFAPKPVTDAGPVGLASGMLTVTDTAMTGTLTISSSTDEPSGATTSFSTTGVRLSNSVGDGSSGYNYRSTDASPFGNFWQGVSTGGTLTVNLSGTFTSSSWQVDGGFVAHTDPAFSCQQGGFGMTIDSQAGTLCTASTTGGQLQTNGSHLSWGFDPDAGATGQGVGMIPVRSASGSTLVASLSGVLASLSIDGLGNITTISGEFRRASGSAGGGCSNHIRWDGTKIQCGSLTTGRLNFTGTAVVPTPAAAWLLSGALGLLAWLRRGSPG
jgi:hypothetical protein